MITTYQANKENELLFGKRNIVIPDKFYIGLSHTAINTSGGGITEPNDPNYARVEVENSSYNFTTSASGIVKNTKEWEFPISSKVWSNITHWFIADRKTGGNILYYDTLPSAMSVDVHQVLKFKPNSILIKRVGV